MGGLAVGFFDGVHIGHQAILGHASRAMTFRNHPMTVLAPDRAPRLIMTPEERIAAIRACGVSEVAMLEFTREIADLPPDEFIERYLRNTQVFCGENWRFGRGGKGDADMLRSRGVDVEVVPYAVYEGERVSSSRIRACIERGEIEAANAMLGKSYEIRGKVTRGKGQGRRMGYPTVNIDPEGVELRLPPGVYEVEMNGIRGIANYGIAPTMGERAWRHPVLEVHLLSDEFQPPAAPTLSVRLLRFIRPERKFDSIDDLKRQIDEDCKEVEA